MVMEASRAEYLADDAYKQQIGRRESSTSNAEPSSSGASAYSLFFIEFDSIMLLRGCVAIKKYGVRNIC